jgi:hypothetical protein
MGGGLARGFVQRLDNRGGRRLVRIADPEINDVGAGGDGFPLDAGDLGEEVGGNEVEPFGAGGHGEEVYRLQRRARLQEPSRGRRRS